jgi:hypothetical protein
VPFAEDWHSVGHFRPGRARHGWAGPLSGRYGLIAMQTGPFPTLIALPAVLVAVRSGSPCRRSPQKDPPLPVARDCCDGVPNSRGGRGRPPLSAAPAAGSLRRDGDGVGAPDLDGLAGPAGGDPDRGHRTRVVVGDVGGLAVRGDRDGAGAAVAEPGALTGATPAKASEAESRRGAPDAPSGSQRRHDPDARSTPMRRNPRRDPPHSPRRARPSAVTPQTAHTPILALSAGWVWIAGIAAGQL